MKMGFPRLKAAVFWRQRWEKDDGTYSNVRITSSLQSLEAYRKASPTFRLQHSINR
jgi:hypothetical protein